MVILSGCASVNFDQSLAKTNHDAADFTQGQLNLTQTKEQREKLERMSGEILQKPLSQNDAVLLALVNSPELQALLAQNWADAANAAQAGRIANPVFTFEQLRSANEIEFSSLIAFGLLDLLTLPQRYNKAQRMIEQTQLQLTGSVVDHITLVRQAWIRAVAAQQSLFYARQVYEAAEASAELARQLQAVGNFNKLQRARQQSFYADAATQRAVIQLTAAAAKEELVRRLGLTDDQVKHLVLPDRLPDLPGEPIAPEAAGNITKAARLDIRLAHAEYESAARAQGLTDFTSITDIELGLRYDSTKDKIDDTKDIKRGYEVSVRVPLFDWGDAQRDAMNARTLAAANRLEATVRAAGSHLRQSYAAYRTAYDVARHYSDEVVPLRKTISEENLLRYNGMLIGVFELLADARDQIHSVIAAIAAAEQFWLSDAALQASLLGKPTVTSVGPRAVAGNGRSEVQH
ncbi:MAG: TolC family protein [Geobacter sp.]|nr:TolC family protein [Geobacter sp.]